MLLDIFRASEHAHFLNKLSLPEPWEKGALIEVHLGQIQQGLVVKRSFLKEWDTGIHLLPLAVACN